MPNRKVITCMLLATLLTLTGCSAFLQKEITDKNHEWDLSWGEETSQSENTSQSEMPFPSESVSQDGEHEPEGETEPIAEQIKSMSIEEKIGQMVIAGLNGYEIDENTRAMIENYNIGGFILFSRNVENSGQLLALINSLKRTNSKNKVPLFISIDEEGGRISRMPEELAKIPSNKEIGKVNNSDLSYKIGGILAEELKLFGFNMDFAPVMDINSNPNNPVIGDRSFGTKAEVVTKLGIQTMKGIQAGGIIPVVKHFPGHGDTSVDSHAGLPVVDNDMNRLKSFELVPFSEAVKSGADAVMIAHILLKSIDPQNPASLSETIITDILRKQLGFNGVVISDDMTMGAIEKNYIVSDAAVKSINAGTDIVLVCHGYDKQVAVINALRSAYEAGIISRERIDESVYRILKLKNKYNLSDTEINSVNVEEVNARILDVLDLITNMQ